MSLNETIIEYLKVFISAPLATVACVLAAIIIFRKELSALLARLQSLKVFGSEVNLDTQSSNEPRTNNASSTVGDVDKLRKQMERIKRDKKNQKAEISERDDLINELLKKLQNMEYKYLNSFLVRKTKKLLHRVVEQDSLKFGAAMSFLTELGASSDEASIIIEVLTKNELVAIKDSALAATDKGKSFDQFIASQFGKAVTS
jgi:predicted RNase H-like nuclease (RuvC/YqgF family)